MSTKRCIQIAVLLVVAFSAAALAQQSTPTTVHIRSARAESRDEVTPGLVRALFGSELLYTVYTVDSGHLTYTLESSDNRQPEVGKDYQVEKVAGGWMVLLIPGKKREAKISFYIKSVSEK